MRAHVQDADKLGKPLVVEEFGKSTPSSRITVGRGLQPGERVHGGPGDFYVRYEFFESVYRIVEKSKRDGGSGQGTNFWVLYDGNGERAGPGSVSRVALRLDDVGEDSRARASIRLVFVFIRLPLSLLRLRVQHPRRTSLSRFRVACSVVITLVPIRPRWRCERRSLRTFSLPLFLRLPSQARNMKQISADAPAVCGLNDTAT